MVCHCCFIGPDGVGCPNPATVHLQYHGGSDGYTHTCARHLLEMIPDRQPGWGPPTAFLIEPDGTPHFEFPVLAAAVAVAPCDHLGHWDHVAGRCRACGLTKTGALRNAAAAGRICPPGQCRWVGHTNPGTPNGPAEHLEYCSTCGRENPGSGEWPAVDVPHLVGG